MNASKQRIAFPCKLGRFFLLLLLFFTASSCSRASSHSFGDRGAEVTDFYPDIDGTYTISLSVNDGQGWSAPDLMTLIAENRRYNNIPAVDAGSSSAGEEFLSNAEAAPPNILFLLDLSNDMDEPCGEVVDTASGETPDLTADTCLESAIEAIDQLTQHYDWAYFGVVGTTDDANEDTFYEIAPIGSTQPASRRSRSAR